MAKKVTKLYQDDYDDGVQKLGVTFDDGTYVQQEMLWEPGTIDEYYALSDAGAPVNTIYWFVLCVTSTVSGPTYQRVEGVETLSFEEVA